MLELYSDGVTFVSGNRARGFTRPEVQTCTRSRIFESPGPTGANKGTLPRGEALLGLLKHNNNHIYSAQP